MIGLGFCVEMAVALFDEDTNPYTKSLMKYKKGEYFFAIDGSPESQYGLINENGEKICGCEIIPISKEEAEEFMNEEGVILIER